MGKKRKSDEVDATPSSRRVTRVPPKHGAGAAFLKPQHDTKSTRLRANVDSTASFDNEEMFSKVRKNTKATDASETERRRFSKGKDTMLEGSPSCNRDAKDLRKNGSAKKLMLINKSLDDNQTNRISDVGFGGLLKIKYPSVHEKLSSWLVRMFDTNTSELVIPLRGSIKVDALAVHRVFGIPMGTKRIEYKKNSGGVSYFEFYKLLGREYTQKAPTFREAKEMLLVDYKGKFDDNWLHTWLLFAVSSLLCPTSCPNLCVRAFHAMFKVEEIKDYNWCQLVIDRLVKGIQDFKAGKLFVSGCLFFLTILYLDSLDIPIPNFVDDKVVPRVSVWTEDKVAQAISLDRSSDNNFGKLFLKAEYSCTTSTSLIHAERIDEFVNANFTAPSVTVSKHIFKEAVSEMCLSVNQAMSRFCSKICQIPCNTNIAAGTSQQAHILADDNTVAAATTSLSILATAVTNRGTHGEIQQAHVAASANSPATTHVEIQHVAANANSSEHVATAAGVNTIQPTRSKVPMSSNLRASTEILETDAGQQQQVPKVSTAQPTSNLGLEDRSHIAGSTEILENHDDSYSGRVKDVPAIILGRKPSSSEQVQRGEGFSANTGDDVQLNNDYKHLSPLGGLPLYEFLESPSKKPSEHYLLEENLILESPLQQKMKRMVDDIVDAEVRKASYNASLELNLPSKEALESDLLGPLFSIKSSVIDEIAHRKRNVAAKISSRNVYSRKGKGCSLEQVAPSGKAACNVKGKDSSLQQVDPSGKAACNVKGKDSSLQQVAPSAKAACNVQGKDSSLQQVAPSGKAACNLQAPSSHKLQSGAHIVKNLMASAAFKDAPDAPSFDLGIDSPIKSKSQGSITDSMLNQVYEETMFNRKHQESTSIERHHVVPKIDTTYVTPEEKDLYKLLCRWKSKSSKVVSSESSPIVFKTKEVTATSMDLANSIAMGKCLSTAAVHVGTSVLSKDPSQERKLIMSPWVSKHILDSPEARMAFVEEHFDFLNTDYDLIFFPILQSHESQPDGPGHWFTFVINLKDSKFQVIDSLRLKNNIAISQTAHKFAVCIINLWKKITSKHEGCSVDAIFKYKIHFVEGYQQFGNHDSGLFTLKAIEFFDGERVPEFIESNELHLRMQMLYQWLSSPANEINWKTVLLEQKVTKAKVLDKTSYSLVENPLFFGGPSVTEKKAKSRLPETLLN